MACKKTSLPARLAAAALALVMAITLAPAAHAVNGCSANNNGPHKIKEWETFVEATCHTKGVDRGVCDLCGQTVYVETDEDPRNHDAVYTDEGNGYHTGICTYHTPSVTIPAEPHEFHNGVCTKCGAIDYSDVALNLPKNLTIPVALNNTGARLSAGDLRVTLGAKSDITDDYNISYIWYYQGAPVASTAEYALPDSIIGEEGVYYYTLFVSAAPKSSLRPPVSSSCNVTVRVEELITASAVVSEEESSFYLGDPDSWSGESVASQIYAAVQDSCPRGADPDYVLFQALPSSAVGRLSVTAVSTRYYFEAGAGRKVLDDVSFIVATGTGAATGDYTVGFTAYDTDGGSYAGVLTITVQQYTGDMDVVLSTSKNVPVTLSSEPFEDFWAEAFPGGILDSITFDETPRSTEGTLKVDYISASASGTSVSTKDYFYVEPGRNQYGIDEVTFIPGAKQTDYITLGFEAQGTRSNGRKSYLSGTLYIFIHNGGSADVTVAAAAGGTTLPPESFQKAYQTATGGTGSSFYIQLLEVPAKGELYVGRTATRQGTLLTQRTVASYPFSYSDSRGESISAVTYVPAAGTASESIRYVACSAQGKPLYTGKITFTTGSATVPVDPDSFQTGWVLDLASTSAGVKLSASSFENLPGSAAHKLTLVSFTLPAISYGAFYYGRTSTSPGTLITSSNSYFSAVSVNPPIGSLSLDNLTFVPAAGVTGLISIPFTASDASNNRYTGTLRITVTSTGTTTPGTTTPGTTNPGTTTPSTTQPKTFSDVPVTQWSYRYITDLATSGALNGYPDGTFQPASPVTLGEALKLIMCVANPEAYSDLPATNSHWASGYLARALKDGLLPESVNQNLDWAADRYTIAELSAKAIQMAPVENAASSPFADMLTTHASAKYVLALYNAKIVTGKTNTAGQLCFYGVNAITREEFATIAWRLQSYLKNGYVIDVN